MYKIPAHVDEHRLYALIEDINETGEPIAPKSEDGRYIATMDQNYLRDLRGMQFESEVMEAYGCAVHDRLRATPDDHTMLSEEEAGRRLLQVTVSALLGYLDREGVAQALAKAADDLRSYRSDELEDLY